MPPAGRRLRATQAHQSYQSAAGSDPAVNPFAAPEDGRISAGTTSGVPRSRGRRPCSPIPPPHLDALEAYEREACRYSQQAMREAGVHGLDRSLADHSTCDLAFLRHFYMTGTRRPFADFWQPGQPLIEPLAIPPFVPTKWRRRKRPIVL